MKLESIYINNFLSIGEAEFRLGDQGIVLIEGNNLDASGADSNGAGKSTLFEAIIWCLWGITLRGLTGDDVVNNKVGKNCDVEMHLVSEGLTYIVQRTRNHKEHGNELFLGSSVGGAMDDLRGPSIKATQEKINLLLGIDYSTFVNSLMFGQGMTGLFSQMTDGEQKAVLDKILGIERYNRAQELAKEQASGKLATLKVVENKVESNQNRMAQLAEDIVSAKKEASSFETQVTKELMELKVKLREEQEKQASIDEQELAEDKTNLAEANEALKEAAKLKGFLSDARALLTQTERAIGKAEQVLASTNQDLKHAEASEPSVRTDCRECGRPFDPSHYHDDLERLKQRRLERIESLTEKLQAAKLEYERLTVQKEEHRKQVAAYESELQEFDELSAAAAELSKTIHSREVKLKTYIDSIKFINKQITTVEQRENRWEAKVKDLEADLVGCKAAAGELEGDLQRLTKEHLALKFWVDGFGNKGLKSFILDGVVPLLNQKANEYAKVLTDGAITVQFSTTTETKGGDKRDKFEVRAFNVDGSDIYKGNSSGEKRRIDLCVMFALQHLVRTQSKSGLNVLFMDEVFDSLDATGAERVIQLLQSMEDKESIFVITHNPDLKQYFDKSVTVVKEGGMSRLES